MQILLGGTNIFIDLDLGADLGLSTQIRGSAFL